MISTNITGVASYAAIAGGKANAVPSSDISFGAILEGAVDNLANLGNDADAKSVAAMSGKGNLTDVVMAVSKAEMALQASVAVRDKVVSAYQDIMRMAV